MAVALTEWLELIDKEYLSDFIVQGGAAVKFAIADDAGRRALARPWPTRPPNTVWYSSTSTAPK